MAETLDLSMFVQHREGTAHLDLAVEGVACANCIGRIDHRVDDNRPVDVSGFADRRRELVEGPHPSRPRAKP